VFLVFSCGQFFGEKTKIRMIVVRIEISGLAYAMWRLMNVMCGIDFVAPFQGLNRFWDIVPRALPWAVMSLRFQRLKTAVQLAAQLKF